MKTGSPLPFFGAFNSGCSDLTGWLAVPRGGQCSGFWNGPAFPGGPQVFRAFQAGQIYYSAQDTVAQVFDEAQFKKADVLAVFAR